jgi:predicted NBD/HSP70 family sugar kinase
MRHSDQTLNRLKVLKAIRRHGPISRSKLPAITGLSAGTITQFTSDLVQRGLILERKEADRRPGRPETHLEINASGGTVLRVGIDRGQWSMTFVDLLGAELFAANLGMVRASSLEELFAGLGDAIAGGIEASPIDRSVLARVGVAIPGVVDSARGNVHFVTTFPQGPVPAARILSEHLGLPVTIENDQACMARAEHWFGPAQDLDTFTLLYLGHAVTSAEYADGLPRSGANGLNSEIGHVKVALVEAGRRCFCGGRGCLNMYCSIFGLLQRTDLLDRASFPDFDRMDASFEEILARAEAGDPEIRRMFDEASTYLALGVGNHLTATDPGNFLISVPTERFRALLEPRFREVLATSTMPGVLAASKVSFIVTSPAWRRLGTAALALEQTFLAAGH